MLRQYTWEKAKAELQHYRRREPEKSELYRIVSHGREQLPMVWEERFQSQYGVLRDEVVSQILSQHHTGFSVWLGEPFQDSESEHFVARYIERGPVSLEKLSITDDIITYTTKDGTAHEFDALEFLALLSYYS